MGGGVPNSALIPGLADTVRIGMIQRRTQAMFQQGQTLPLRNFQHIGSRISPHQETTILHGGDHFRIPRMPGSPIVGKSSSRGPTQLRSSRQRVSHSDGLCPAPVFSPGPSYFRTVSCNCFIYTGSLRKHHYLIMTWLRGKMDLGVVQLDK
jgi:hypothetical protein